MLNFENKLRTQNFFCYTKMFRLQICHPLSVPPKADRSPSYAIAESTNKFAGKSFRNRYCAITEKPNRQKY